VATSRDLIPQAYCPHNSGITMTESRIFCEDCQAEMVWVTREYLEGLRREPTEVERELRRQVMVKNQALQRIRQYLREVGVE
jgi:hypothetical protein